MTTLAKGFSVNIRSALLRFLVNAWLFLGLWLMVALQLAGAASDNDSSAPPPKTPTQSCPAGEIYDSKTRKCQSAKHGAFSDRERYAAVRELAYAARYESAGSVLDAMTQQESAEVLTYRGFLLRKAGQFEAAARYYKLAIAADPFSVLARSYLGQGHVETGNLVAARALHEEIVTLRGTGSWAEVSLRQAIATGQTSAY